MNININIQTDDDYDQTGDYESLFNKIPSSSIYKPLKNAIMYQSN